MLAKGYSGREVRYRLLTAHYRETFNFTLEGLDSGRASLDRLDECLGKLREVAGGTAAAADSQLVERFTGVMDDDLNVSAAWGIVFEWVSEMNRLLAANQLTAVQAAGALAGWERIDSVFGLGRKAAAAAPTEIQALLEQRQAARKAKDFQRADAVRDELKAKGWLIEDTPKGARLKRV